ncbi:MAG: hypothetical protein LH628_20695 [Microcoleus sp. CAN_BIN18]|nr:hypothetical protein [Microcoleus sp. CAN_BIN18]
MTNALQASDPVKRSRNRDFLYFFSSSSVPQFGDRPIAHRPSAKLFVKYPPLNSQSSIVEIKVV